ncbi:MAG: HD domain-containing protein [Candidatus Jordarchaeum sp.]|uniref:HD domain-containing protein n=1 Tax=Candidatus Jordarchaeum sp. TaxID=2823881 RepID=UPI00404A4230
MYFQESLHGEIRPNELERKLLNTDAMKSLSDKMDIGNINLVYPNAKHTRLDHSLGILYVANEICRLLLEKEQEIEEEVKIIRLASMLHDVGHGPFSHGSEIIIHEKTGLTHEEMSKKIITDKTSKINMVLRDSGISKKEINEMGDMILGVNKRRPFLGEMIHWMVDADKLDYLPRDAQSTGFLPSLVQSRKIIDSMNLHNDHIVFEDVATPYLESMVFAEAIYYKNIHHHSTVRKADQTLSRAIKIAIEKERVTPYEVQKMTDNQIINFLKEMGGNVSDLVSKIEDKPLNTILIINWEELSKEQINRLLEIREDNQQKDELEQAIANKINSAPYLTIVDISPPPHIQEANAPIIIEEKPTPLKSISTLTRAISENHPKQWSTRVYSETKIRESEKRLREFFLSQI